MELKEVLAKATKERWATGHFNASELDQFRAIVEACAEVKSPAIIGTSEGERRHVGLTEVIAVRDAFRKDFDIPIFLNADHHKSVESAKEAIDAGYDSVHIDLSALPFEENVRGTREVVAYSKNNRARAGNNIPTYLRMLVCSVEGEVGYFVTESSRVYKKKFEIPPESLTKPEEAEEFVKKTGVDRLAIAVGNIHGISLDEPDLDVERIKAIRATVPEKVALVLHAGSGIPDEQIRAAIGAGITNIHISTELRVAFVKELRKTLSEELDEVAMYKLDQSAIRAMKELVKEKLVLFGSANRVQQE